MGTPATIVLQGYDGSEWVISGPGTPEPVTLTTSPDGIYQAPTNTVYEEYAFQDGATLARREFLRRTFQIGLDVYGGAGMSWEDRYGDILAALDEVEPATLLVYGETTARWITVRLNREARMTPKRDPHIGQYAHLDVELTCESPFWQSAPLLAVWESTTDTRGTDSSTETGHPIETGTVTVTNPTRMPAWPYWQAQGIDGIRWVLPDVSFGSNLHERAEPDEDRRIVLPALEEGEHAWWNTDPQSKDGPCGTVLDTPLYIRMRGEAFMYPVPARTLGPVEIPVGVSNAPKGAKVRLTLRRYWRDVYGRN